MGGGRSSRDATGDACQRRRRSVHQVVLLTGGPGLGLDSSRAFAIVRTSAAWLPVGGDTGAFWLSHPRPHSQSYCRKAPRPAYTAAPPSDSSMRMSWLYFSTRSLRAGAPVLIWPVPMPTTRSEMKVSPVSPLR